MLCRVHALSKAPRPQRVIFPCQEAIEKERPAAEARPLEAEQETRGYGIQWGSYTQGCRCLLACSSACISGSGPGGRHYLSYMHRASHSSQASCLVPASCVAAQCNCCGCTTLTALHQTVLLTLCAPKQSKPVPKPHSASRPPWGFPCLAAAHEPHVTACASCFCTGLVHMQMLEE